MSDAQESSVGSAANAVRTPPYVSFQTLLTMIEDLKTNGLPQKIDRSVLKRFSGGVGSQLLLAIRSLSLIDAKDQPTPALRELVDAHGTPKFKATLKPVIEATYPFLRDLDLKTATPTMFADAFRNGTSAKEDVLRKCRTFYLHAARYVGIDIGQRLTSGSSPRTNAPRSPRSKDTRRKAPSVAHDSVSISVDETHPKRRHHDTDYQEKLLDKFPKFDPGWPDELKKQWFDGFKSFQQMLSGDQKK